MRSQVSYGFDQLAFRGLLVPMSMMGIRHVWVGMSEPTVFMPMGVRLARRIACLVFVLMMLIMNMWMHVSGWLVRMRMLMMLGKVQPDAQRHKSTGNKEARRDGITESDDGNSGTKEWCGRKIGARSGGA